MSYLPLLLLFIPLGIGLLFGISGLLAHRGFAFWGTWTMLTSSATFIISAIGLFALSAYLVGNPGYSELIAYITLLLLALSTLGYTVGLNAVCLRSRKLFSQATILEKITQDLATQTSPNQPISPPTQR
ncbi:MAG: hypothetical protein AAGC74_06165 [Verrucomicrobiota bacterium]